MSDMYRPVKGYEGLYEVSTNGSVRSVYRGRNTGRVLRPQTRANGYKFVHLCKDNKPKQTFVHRIVASAFIENPDNRPNVNHIDGDPSNNSVENLEWATQSENVLHSYYVLKRGRDKWTKLETTR